MAAPFRLTKQTRLLLTHMLKHPAGDHYGFEISKATGLKPGTLYPTFSRLESAGWIESRWEEIDHETTRRPARRYYRLTPLGAIEATTVLAVANAKADEVPGVLGA